MGPEVSGLAKQMKHWKRTGKVLAFAVVAIMLLAACAGIRVYGPCRLPKQLSESDLFGEWHLNYTDFLTEPSRVLLSGDEAVILNADHTFAHTFQSSEFSYADEGKRWELLLDAPDSPKLKMHGMKYFADGPDQADPRVPYSISPQMPDRFKIQDYNEDHRGDHWIRMGVTYPTDGFIYLYPRLCDGALSLVQMMDPRQDPDDMTVQNPVFKRVGTLVYFEEHPLP